MKRITLLTVLILSITSFSFAFDSVKVNFFRTGSSGWTGASATWMAVGDASFLTD